jgi:ribosome-associated toxin RatA of RatAB toxin-antitoxin module
MCDQRSILFRAGLVFLASGCATTSQIADSPSALERAAQVVRLEAQPMSAELGPRDLSGDVQSEAVPIEGSELVRGRATVVVEAPLDTVRDHVTDYGSYAEYLPRQRRSQVLRRKRDGSQEVYFQWSALHGAMKVWVRGEMRPRVEGDVEIYESHVVEGNVDAASAVWRLRPLDESRTEVTIELFLDPQFTLPATLLNSGIVAGAEDVARAFRDRVEGR